MVINVYLGFIENSTNGLVFVDVNVFCFL